MDEEVKQILKDMLALQKESFKDMHRELREIKIRLLEQLGGN